MEIKSFIDELSDLNLQLRVEDDSIDVIGATHQLTPGIMSRVEQNKARLLEYYRYINGIDDPVSDVPAVNTVEQQPAARHLDFSLFYFGNADVYDDERDKYKLLLEGARYADRNGFTAVWTPERHFNEFAGLYPSPAVLGAAIAAVTRRISIRAGSVVLPLHHPLRVAEDWSVIDNLSGGRAGIACASGWQANDFVLAPGSYKKRQEVMYEKISQVQQLWRGEPITLEDGNGQLKETRIFPRPLQKQLPIWITTNGNPESFRLAGKLGYNILTNFWGSTPEELADKITIYREAYREHGHPPGADKIVLMLHTYIAATREAAYEKARTPMVNYLRSSFGLFRHNNPADGASTNARELTQKEVDNMLDYSFYRYASGSSLVGSPEDALQVLQKLSAMGVDEIACLIDFGIDFKSTMEGLEYLTRVKEKQLRITDCGLRNM